MENRPRLLEEYPELSFLGLVDCCYVTVSEAGEKLSVGNAAYRKE